MYMQHKTIFLLKQERQFDSSWKKSALPNLMKSTGKLVQIYATSQAQSVYVGGDEKAKEEFLIF